MQIAALPGEASEAPAPREHIRPYSQPYRSTPTFDQNSLPSALQREHRTKAGTWAVIRLIEGQLRYVPEDGGVPRIVTASTPFVVAPEAPHRVEPVGAMTMRIDFYDHEPFLPPP